MYKWKSPSQSSLKRQQYLQTTVLLTSWCGGQEHKRWADVYVIRPFDDSLCLTLSSEVQQFLPSMMLLSGSRSHKCRWEGHATPRDNHGLKSSGKEQQHLQSAILLKCVCERTMPHVNLRFESSCKVQHYLQPTIGWKGIVKSKRRSLVCLREKNMPRHSDFNILNWCKTTHTLQC
jgi:hypothetical protein